jgi:hypothetical protein
MDFSNGEVNNTTCRIFEWWIGIDRFSFFNPAPTFAMRD